MRVMWHRRVILIQYAEWSKVHGYNSYLLHAHCIHMWALCYAFLYGSIQRIIRIRMILYVHGYPTKVKNTIFHGVDFVISTKSDKKSTTVILELLLEMVHLHVLIAHFLETSCIIQTHSVRDTASHSRDNSRPLMCRPKTSAVRVLSLKKCKKNSRRLAVTIPEISHPN